ncbi:hypothetical protein L1S34_14560 [Flavobacterium sp. K77]|uniref:hypothetical protein n=1 Tax=Flavobacterium sp. K77 TaxID=2910676 RepID=UPI001F3109D6|nr:hypothetical protein [Flavobacterium sp. K77]MCF6142511.1 hypothetical protein [Flavobacterium sp. K77]
MKIKLSFGHYLLIFFISVIVFIQVRHNYIQNKVESDGKYIVVKFISKKEKRKSTDYNFSYYVNGKLDTTNATGLYKNYFIASSSREIEFKGDLKIDSFYLAKFNPKYPERIIVNPEKIITDSKLIKKFGFD